MDFVDSVNGGIIRIAIFAAGTPTNAGDAYVCQQANFWMSDMGICPENLSVDCTPACNEQSSVGINMIEKSSENKYNNTIEKELKIYRSNYNTIEFSDASGKLIAVEKMTNQKVNTSNLTSGIYFAKLYDSTTKNYKIIKVVKL
jgi:hypothetical protein